MEQEGGRRGKPHVVLRMEAVVLVIPLVYGVSRDPLPSTPAREKSEAVSMATGSAARAPEVVVGGSGAESAELVIFKHCRDEVMFGPRLLHLEEEVKTETRWWTEWKLYSQCW